MDLVTSVENFKSSHQAPIIESFRCQDENDYEYEISS